MWAYPHPSGAAEYDDERRRARLRETRFGTRWRERRGLRIAARFAVIPLLFLALFAQYWRLDVAPERARLARTAPAVLPIAGPSGAAAADTAVFDLVGLGSLDATDTARALPTLSQLGSVWAVRYDNTGIDTKVIADLIVRVTEAAHIPKVVLAGHSMGGVIALEIAHHLHTASTRQVLAVLLDCTPIDLHAVRPESRDQGEELMRWVGWFPGARESRLLRLIAETYSRRDRYQGGRYGIEPDDFREAVRDSLREKILTTDVASTGLIESQFKAIVAGGAVNHLRALAEPADGKPRPAIVFIRPRNPYADYIVDVAYTHRALIDRVGGPDGTLLVVTTRTTGHANPKQRPAEYNAVILHQIVPFVRLIERTPMASG
ncbi:alpha/beta fold hydrolase [Nocardia otitidiscaviarum]|uniref:alpha/beta fold hydrolase n=1 Tax=Nocardia otitidiscaviarum TaxID=1823 RepID=UPI00189614C5|nr:alpha/beta hydrolase [Nocardia otitidiscaviarum]MBF6239613.1 alpha/beta hydrolase [Nocardia otitidiscaviarum]